MAIAQVKIVGKREAWATQFKPEVLRGAPLLPAGRIGTEFYDALAPSIDRMLKETQREVRELFTTFAGDSVAWAFDASIASQARILSNALQDKFAAIFAKVGQRAAERMVSRADRDSKTKLGISLREMSGDYTLKTNVYNDQLRDVFSASVTEATSLIKQRLVTKYLGDVQGSVMRSIQTGGGLSELIPALDKYGVQTRNWAKNVALDQTRKAINSTNAARMQALGVKKFQWCHSGGSNHPRDYHKNVLNGQIFSFDKLPHLDGPDKGERGIPGQAPYCRCFMRPVWEFNYGSDEQ